MVTRRELLGFVTCAALGFAAARAVDAGAADCHRTYSPDPPYALEGDYPFVTPEGATTSDGARVEDVVPYHVEGWLPPLVEEPSAWRLAGDGFELVLEAAP